MLLTEQLHKELYHKLEKFYDHFISSSLEKSILLKSAVLSEQDFEQLLNSFSENDLYQGSNIEDIREQARNLRAFNLANQITDENILKVYEELQSNLKLTLMHDLLQNIDNPKTGRSLIIATNDTVDEHIYQQRLNFAAKAKPDSTIITVLNQLRYYNKRYKTAMERFLDLLLKAASGIC